MAIKLNLDTIRDSIKKKYDSFDVEFDKGVLSLRNPILLPAKSREQMLKAIESLNTDETSEENFAEQEGSFRTAVRELIQITATSAATAEKFLEAIAPTGEEGEEDIELLVLTEVFSSYMGDQQVGEASPSES